MITITQKITLKAVDWKMSKIEFPLSRLTKDGLFSS